MLYLNFLLYYIILMKKLFKDNFVYDFLISRTILYHFIFV